MKKKTLKKEDYLKLVGLFTLSANYAKKLDEIQKVVAEIINLEGNDDYDKGGYIIQDNMWDGGDFTSFEKGLKENFTIKK